MGKLFGGGSKSKQQSTQQSTQKSYNEAYPFLQEKFGGAVDYTNRGMESLQALLNGDRTGLNNFLGATGFDFERDRGESSINMALGQKGLRNSGAALKGLTRFNNDIRNQYAGSYIDTLMKQIGGGFNAGQLIGGAGARSEGQSTGQSTGSSSSKGGIGQTLGSIAGAVAKSDPRLKTNIKKLGEYSDGLGWYEFEYKENPGVTKRGVMADEVAKLRPWALGPKVDNEYLTVDYSKLSKKG